MISITPRTPIYVYSESVDFRKGIDGLSGVCKNKLKQDPFSGSLFVFRNRSHKAIKLLIYDGQGFWVYHKRLSEGKFKWWPKSSKSSYTELFVKELSVLIWNGNPEEKNMQKDWKKIDKR